MQLTRRDALAALSAAGVVAGGAAVALSMGDSDGTGDRDGPIAEADLATMVAAAEVLYPSELENVAEFVRGYVRTRAQRQPDHGRAIADAVAYLDEYSKAWYDEEFGALDPGRRDEALKRMNVDTADPDPEGSDVERVRYYVVNELLFALYASPTGGKFVGIENPQGHPGGTTSYQRGGMG